MSWFNEKSIKIKLKERQQENKKIVHEFNYPFRDREREEEMPGVVTQSVLKTGHDAFQAKASFVSAGYASSVINRNHDDYVRYTESIANLLESKPRKQTALVNIGYAARVAVVTRAIEHFISSSFSLSPINLIIIGCGLDPLGMWSLTLSSSVNVIEIDCDDFASMKSTFHSSILPHPCLSRICTVTCDLQSGDSVSLGLESVKNRIDFTAPTMVVSELVLIYLSNVPDLLHTFVGLFPDLTLAAFEPFCPAERHENQTIVRSESTATTAENDFNAHRRGFEAAYLDRFREKVKELHGMGSRPSEVRRLLMRQGFLKDSIIVERAGRRFFDAVGGKFKALEPFDEHAGLALYLRSYFFCECRSRGELLKRDFAVKTIETDLEEEEAREIFKFSYESHGKKYKSVAKVSEKYACAMINNGTGWTPTYTHTIPVRW